jgi:hypothetical protein
MRTSPREPESHAASLVKISDARDIAKLPLDVEDMFTVGLSDTLLRSSGILVRGCDTSSETATPTPSLTAALSHSPSSRR